MNSSNNNSIYDNIGSFIDAKALRIYAYISNGIVLDNYGIPLSQGVSQKHVRYIFSFVIVIVLGTTLLAYSGYFAYGNILYSFILSLIAPFTLYILRNIAMNKLIKKAFYKINADKIKELDSLIITEIEFASTIQGEPQKIVFDNLKYAIEKHISVLFIASHYKAKAIISYEERKTDVIAMIIK